MVLRTLTYRRDQGLQGQAVVSTVEVAQSLGAIQCEVRMWDDACVMNVLICEVHEFLQQLLCAFCGVLSQNEQVDLREELIESRRNQLCQGRILSQEEMGMSA